MIIPTTGIVFFFGAFVFIYLARRFWQCYKLENIRIAKFFSYSFFLIGLNYIVLGIPCLLLIESQIVWRIVAPIYFFLVIGGWLLFGYAVFSVLPERFNRFKRIIGALFLMILIPTTSVFLIFYPPHYFYTDGTLDWEIESILVLPALIIMPLIVIPSVIIFFQEAKKAKDKKTKIRSLGFGIALIFMITGVIIDLFLITVLKLHPIYSDLNYFIVFLILAITLIITWGPPKPKWVTKIE